MSADLWAGAEVQVATLVSFLARSGEASVSAVLFNDGRLAQELRALGVEVAVFDEARHTSLGLLTRTARFLRRARPDVVHTHRNKDTVIGALAARIGGVPHVVRTVHGSAEPLTGWRRIKYLAYEALDRAVLWWLGDRVIAVSRHLAQSLAESGYRRASLATIHNGIDLARVRASRARAEVRGSLGIAESALVVGTAGRLCAVKAQDRLLRAAREILKRRPDARFVIAGAGPLEPRLLSLASELGIAPACIFTGPRADVCDLVAAMDVFALPSLHEGIPMALLEAMALARPVVATAVGGVPEIVSHGIDGLLVPARDDRALADACLALGCDPDGARVMGARAHQTVARRFSHDVNGHAVLETYRAIADRREARVEGPSVLELCRGLVAGPVQYAWNRLRRGAATLLAHRRMSKLRRDPAALKARLRSAARILVVCQGNIIRSPYAASLLARALGEQDVFIASAGLAAVPGRPPHPTAVQAATARAVDLRSHAASPLEPETVASSDAIFVMDLPQLVMMHQRFPAARGKTFLLSCLAADAPLEILDPYAGEESDFHACYDHIARAVRPIVAALTDPRAIA
jgi:glycosyltransferase involved in cell wall biosynthesis/protein-tyrosine-phosphatase